MKLLRRNKAHWLRVDVHEAIMAAHAMPEGWRKLAALHALACATDRELRTMYRRACKLARDPMGPSMLTVLPLGPPHNHKVYNVAQRLGEGR